MESKYKRYPDKRFRPFCLNPLEGNYSVIDTKKEKAVTVSEKLLSYRDALALANQLNKDNRG